MAQSAFPDQPSRTPIIRVATETDLDQAVLGLAHSRPHLSARSVLSRGQRLAFALSGIGLVVIMAISPLLAGRLLMALAVGAHLVALAYRTRLLKHGIGESHMVTVSDAQARAVADNDLPRYTVLVPAYHEPHLGELLAHLDAVDYPSDKLDIRLLLEQDDEETLAAAQDARLRHPLVIDLVPAREPRTKPKACNVGLEHGSGELVTIYDAEDQPDPLQLRRAAVALARLGPRYACVQAQLGYYNSRQNLLTRWFTLEYGTWFRFLLPGLVAVGAVVPLGGTSNHFRSDVLKEVGAWDPFNVTEDADLGVRLQRLGYRVAVLDSETLEEANSDSINWIKQRSRWYKGYLQTWLVHCRQLRPLPAELGWRGVIGLFLFIAGTPLLTATNIMFWTLTAMWFARQPEWIAALFPGPIFYAGLICLVFGNLSVLYTGIYAARSMRRPDLLGAALLTPLYWGLMGVAATKAMVQLVRQPSYWEKTTHGLHLRSHTTSHATTKG